MNSKNSVFALIASLLAVFKIDIEKLLIFRTRENTHLAFDEFSGNVWEVETYSNGTDARYAEVRREFAEVSHLEIPQAYSDIVLNIMDNERIKAIKAVRDFFCIGLLEAKKAIDAICTFNEDGGYKISQEATTLTVNDSGSSTKWVLPIRRLTPKDRLEVILMYKERVKQSYNERIHEKNDVINGVSARVDGLIKEMERIKDIRQDLERENEQLRRECNKLNTQLHLKEEHEFKQIEKVMAKHRTFSDQEGAFLAKAVEFARQEPEAMVGDVFQKVLEDMGMDD
jgi:ribosomal protein L7/L12/regulator of replication initiation timing